MIAIIGKPQTPVESQVTFDRQVRLLYIRISKVQVGDISQAVWLPGWAKLAGQGLEIAKSASPFVPIEFT